jgi:transposase-like protein
MASRFAGGGCHNVIMYSNDVRSNAIALIESGFSLRSISMSTGINRATLREWRDHPERTRTACPRCADNATLPNRTLTTRIYLASISVTAA